MDSQYQINHHVQRFIVGFIAISLAIFTNVTSQTSLDSISQSYHAGDWPRNIFVGFLFAIAAFLFSYRGDPNIRFQKWISKLAALSAIGIAVFPCGCGYSEAKFISTIHYASAAVMFFILGYFCWDFMRAAKRKDTKNAAFRALIYKMCFAAIVLSIAVLALDWLLSGIISSCFEALVFWGEAVALVAFGIAWLTASRTLPILTDLSERIRFLESE